MREFKRTYCIGICNIKFKFLLNIYTVMVSNSTTVHNRLQSTHIVQHMNNICTVKRYIEFKLYVQSNRIKQNQKFSYRESKTHNGHNN